MCISSTIGFQILTLELINQLETCIHFFLYGQFQSPIQIEMTHKRLGQGRSPEFLIGQSVEPTFAFQNQKGN